MFDSCPDPRRTLWHPPTWLDRTRTGRINHYHHPDEYLYDPDPPEPEPPNPEPPEPD